MSIPYTLVEKSVLRKVGSPIPIGDILVETKAWMETLESQSSITNFYYYAEVIDGETKNRWFVYSDMARAYFNLSDNYMAADSASAVSTALPQFKTINGVNLIGSGNIEVATTLPQFKTINNQNLVGAGNIEINNAATIHSWKKPLLTDLDTLPVVATDIMKIAFVSETNTFFVLVAIDPIKWVPLGSNSIVGGTVSTVTSGANASLIINTGTSKAPTLNCPISSTEGTTVTVSITDYNATNIYSVSVSMGLFSVNKGSITWKLPYIAIDTIARIVVSCTEPTKTETGMYADINVVNIPVSSDSSILYTGASMAEFTGLYNTSIAGNQIVKDKGSALQVISNSIYTDGLCEINDSIEINGLPYTIVEIVKEPDGTKNINNFSAITPSNTGIFIDGTILYSTAIVGNEASKVFDGIDSTSWKSALGKVANEFVGFKFNIPRTINKYKIIRDLIPADSAMFLTGWEFQASNNGTDWTILDTIVNNTTYTNTTFAFLNTNPYFYYRLVVKTNVSATNVTVPALTLYIASEKITQTTPPIPTAIYTAVVLTGYANSNIIYQDAGQPTFKGLSSIRAKFGLKNISSIFSKKDTLTSSKPLVSGEKIVIVNKETGTKNELIVGDVVVSDTFYGNLKHTVAPMGMVSTAGLATSGLTKGSAPLHGYNGVGYSDGTYYYQFGGYGYDYYVSRILIGADMSNYSAWTMSVVYESPSCGGMSIFDDNGYVYMIGGTAYNAGLNGAAFKNIWKAVKGSNLLIKNNWTLLSTGFPINISNAKVFDDGVYIYLLGGNTLYSNPDNTAGNLSTVWKIKKGSDIGNQANWSQGALPAVSNFSNIITDGKFVYLIGGNTGDYAQSDIIMKAEIGTDLALVTNWTLATLPFKHYGTSFADAKYVYTYGGYNPSDGYTIHAHRALKGSDLTVKTNWELCVNMLGGTGAAYGNSLVFADYNAIYVFVPHNGNSWAGAVYRLPLTSLGDGGQYPTKWYTIDTTSVTLGTTPSIVYKSTNNIEFKIGNTTKSPADRTDTLDYNINGSVNANNTNEIPVMTSDILPYGQSLMSGTALNSTTTAFKAFDNNPATFAAWNNINGFLQIKTGTCFITNKYSIVGFNTASADSTPKDWILKGSLDGIIWEDLHKVINQTWISGETKVFNFNNNKPFVYYKFDISANNGNTAYTSVCGMSLFSFNIPLNIGLISDYSDVSDTVGGMTLQTKVKLRTDGEIIKEISGIITI